MHNAKASRFVIIKKQFFDYYHNNGKISEDMAHTNVYKPHNGTALTAATVAATTTTTRTNIYKCLW